MSLRVIGGWTIIASVAYFFVYAFLMANVGDVSFLPHPCLAFTLLMLAGFGLRAFGGNAPEERMPAITHDIALVHHLFPPEADLIKMRGGFISDPVPHVSYELQRLPVPKFLLQPDSIRFKVRPGSAAKPGLFSAFFESLHHVVTAPLQFDLIACEGTAYFQIFCTPQDQAALEQQFSLYFPDSELEPHEPGFEGFKPLMRWRYEHALGRKKRLGDFTLDPYAQLFAVFDRLEDSAGMMVSVRCFPLTEDLLTRALNSANQQTGGDSQGIAQAMASAALTKTSVVAGQVYEGYREGVKERRQNAQKALPGAIRDLVSKMPAWGMLVSLEATDDKYLEGLISYVQQFESAEQHCVCYDPDDWMKYTQFHSKYANLALPYCLVSCDELAAVAHFPSADKQFQRLERAGVSSGLPPALYLE